VFQKRHRDLGQARDGMASAYNAIVDATSDPPPPGSPTVAEAARRLAELCRVMRWQRQADAWQRIANSET
jgi:hypothetical protein